MRRAASRGAAAWASLLKKAYPLRPAAASASSHSAHGASSASV